MINEDFALLVLTVGPVLKQYNLPKIQIILFFLLIVPLFNFLHFSYSFTQNGSSYTYNSTHFVGISPVVLLILLVYSWITKSVIIGALRTLRFGSEQEQTSRFDKMVDFYYQKFKESTDIELIDIKSRYDQYPLEAQKAINKIVLERK